MAYFISKTFVFVMFFLLHSAIVYGWPGKNWNSDDGEASLEQHQNKGKDREQFPYSDDSLKEKEVNIFMK